MPITLFGRTFAQKMIKGAEDEATQPSNTVVNSPKEKNYLVILLHQLAVVSDIICALFLLVMNTETQTK